MVRPAHLDYHVGWICALSVEMGAATAMLDEDYGIIKGRGRDQNTYRAGRIHDHNVIIAGLPAGIDGLVAAAHVAKDIVRTFEHLRFILLVGIGGGLPDSENEVDIRLGDVVVGIPSGNAGGVVQHDKGKAKHGGAFELKGALNAPPYALLTAITTLRAQPPSDQGRPMLRYLSDMIRQYPLYDIPSEQKDRLFDSSYPHPEGQNNCDQCLPSHEIIRQGRKTTGPQIHYGKVASGNQVVKDSAFRENLRASYGALCVEMEAAGIANICPCLTVRGICDYADSHKNDEWHPYAAAAAVAWTKELLLYVTSEHLDLEQSAQDIAGSFKSNRQAIGVRAHGGETDSQNKEYQSCHRAFKLSSYEEQKNINPARAPHTCLWVLNSPKYRQWQENSANDLLWISADPGCGKSVLSRSLIDRDLQTTTERTCCYFFFKDNKNQDNLASAFCALLHQLFTSQPHLLAHAIPAWRRNGDKLTQEVDELWRIFLAATADPDSRDVFCVLDALDECPDTDRHRLIDKLVVFFADARATKPRTQSLKILVTSRPYDSIQLNFQRSINGCALSVPIIRLRGEDENGAIRSEIDSVIRTRVAEMTETVPLSPKASELLEQKLLRMKNRTYLWLALVIDGIYENLRDSSLQHDEDSINSIISTLPKSVDDAYEKVLNKVRTTQRDTVRTIFHIIVGAQRALSLGEMSLALGLATSEDIDSLESVVVEKIRLQKHIREWCGLFVFIENSKIYLVHQTAKEFLICHSEMKCGAWKHSLSTADTARILTQVCLRAICWPLGIYYRLFRQLRDPDFMTDALHLVEYAEDAWVSHHLEDGMNRFAPLHDELQLLWNRLNAGTLPLERFEPESPSWRPGAKYVGRVLVSLSQVHEWWHTRCTIPCLAVLADIVRKVIDINRLSLGVWGTSLKSAVGCGSEEIPQILLYIGVKFSRQEKYFGDALYSAAQHGREHVVRTLLEVTADVNHQGGLWGFALLQAASLGHELVVRVLLDAGADVNYQDMFYGNPLQAAAEHGHEHVVRTLLNAGADVGVQGGRYALQAAAPCGHCSVVQTLLEAGADVWAKGRFKNAFEAASSHNGVLEVLLRWDRCADRERLLDLRLQVAEHHHDEGFWLNISSDVDEVKQIINSLWLPALQWHTDTLASFRLEGDSRKYIRLGFLRRLKGKEKEMEKERNSETRLMTPTMPGQWVD